MGVEDHIDLIKEIAQDEEQTRILLQLLGTFILMNEQIDDYSISFHGQLPGVETPTHCRFKFKIMENEK